MNDENNRIYANAINMQFYGHKVVVPVYRKRFPKIEK